MFWNLEKKTRFDQPFRVFYTSDWRRCLQYAGIKYFICYKINILGDRFGWFLALDQAKTNLWNASKAFFPTKCLNQTVSWSDDIF